LLNTFKLSMPPRLAPLPFGFSSSAQSPEPPGSISCNHLSRSNGSSPHGGFDAWVCGYEFQRAAPFCSFIIIILRRVYENGLKTHSPKLLNWLMTG